MELRAKIPEKNIYVLTNEEIIQNPFITEDRKAGFYRFLADKHGGYDNVKSIDCCKILVAKNIMDSWYDAVDRFMTPIDHTSLSMQICINGPKVGKNLKNNEIELEEGWIEVNDPT